MFLKLRIVFTIISALFLAAIIPASVWGQLWGFGICGGGALFFFALMLLCKQAQEKQEEDNKPKADFLNPQNTDEKKEE